MNYIITGGTGFIGTHLTNLILEQEPGAKVWNLDIVEPGTPNPAVKNYKPAVKEGCKLDSTFIRHDVREPIGDLPFTPTPDDIIFNFAAVHRTPGHPDREYFETNIRGAENVTAFAERWGIKRIVFTSSIAPYGASEELKHEDTLPMPNTPYGISKLVAEKIHMIWANGGNVTPDGRSGAHKGRPYDAGDLAGDHEGRPYEGNDLAGRRLLIVRPGVVFGRGENGNFTRLYWGIRKHTFAYPGRKDTIKACIYVKELVRFILWRINQVESGKLNAAFKREQSNSFELSSGSGVDEVNVESELYNCTFEPAYTIEEIVTAMKRVGGLKQWVPYIPNFLIMPAAFVAQCLGSPMGICPARVKKLQVSTNICGKKLAECGYKFRWTLDEAIRDWQSDCGGDRLS